MTDKWPIEEYEKEIKTSFNDSLTGLFNHGLFQILLDTEITRSKRYGDLFTLALVNIDFFAVYNKHHGALKGDSALREIAKIILENVRGSDITARYSGDSFAMILRNTESNFLLNTMENIRKSVQSMFPEFLTVSSGLASYPLDATSKETLIEKAQEALQQAKTKGKNRVIVFEKKAKVTSGSKFKILIVDDELKNIKLMEALLTPLNYHILQATNGEEALSIINRVDIDLILLDIMMPDMDGFEVCRRLKNNELTRLIPIIMLTALDDIDSKIKGISVGADDFITKPPNKLELKARINSLLKVNTLNKKLIGIESILISLANAVEAKDSYTQGHTFRVSDLAVLLGKRLGLSEPEIDALRLGGILHDIGKIGVPEAVLNKPGSLDPDEWKLLQNHSDIGHKICLPLKKILGPVLDIIRHHHEKLDGSGYPDGLKEEEISVLVRIMSVVDIFDALISERPYRAKMPTEKAFDILFQDAEKSKIDKTIVEHLKEIIGQPL